jgi:Fur family ferric uptake transcriptional regulator
VLGQTEDDHVAVQIPVKDSDTVETRIEDLCAKRGLRMTEPRRVIARVLSAAEDHPDAEALYDRVKEVDPTISMATIYRTMKLFEEMDIVSKRDFGDGRARYEPQSGPEDHHHHMIDVETGEVLEFYNQDLEDLKKRIARDLGFDLVDHHLELFGTRRKKQH